MGKGTRVTAAFEHGWEPDEAVVDAVLDGRASLTTLEDADRCVVVATLSERGESVEQIADRLDCCTRVVKRLRAAPLTRTLVRAMRAEHAQQRAESKARRASTADQGVAAEQARRITQLSGQVDALVESTRRLRAELAAERSKPQAMTVWCYRRRPTVRELAQAGPTLFDML